MEMDWMFHVYFFILIGLVLGVFFLRVLHIIWWRPMNLKRHFESEGIRGPPFKVFYGNSLDITASLAQSQSAPMSSWSHDISPKVLPHYHVWSKTYGKVFVCWFGNKPRMFVHNPDMIKEILADKTGQFQRRPTNSNPLSQKLVGKGLVGLNGQKWAVHRRIVNPAFHFDKLKAMIPTMVERCEVMLEEWGKSVESNQNEFDVSKEFRKLTSDVIATTAFGSSYKQGKRIFELQAQHIKISLTLLRSVYVPGSRFLPTKTNRECWKLEREIRRCLRDVIVNREKTMGNSASFGEDLLGLMMSSNKGTNRLSTDEIIDECKTFYLAGHVTTSSLLTWTMILLGMHQDWQHRAREEVLQVCGKNNNISEDCINKLRIVGMVINEALRLYPPALFVMRHCEKYSKLGGHVIPEGTQLVLPILAVHHDPDLWGGDVNEFNPERFRDGVANANNHPLAFMPFGFGPKICIGGNFAVLEAKVVLTMILQRFSFEISPSYEHSPGSHLTLQPQHGAQLNFYRT